MKCVAHICGLINQHYADFNEPLKKGLVKMFDSYGGKEEDKVCFINAQAILFPIVNYNLKFCLFTFAQK